MKKTIIYGIAISVFASMFMSIGPMAAKAMAACDSRFLTAPAWYRGVTDGDCNIVIKDSGDEALGGGIGTFLLTIAMNIVEIMMHLVAYVSVAYIIIGGFKYMTSAGSQDGSVKARKTITNAVIGLVISLVAIGVITFIMQGITN